MKHKKQKVGRILVFGVDCSVNTTAITAFICTRKIGKGLVRVRTLGSKMFLAPKAKKVAPLAYKMARLEIVVAKCTAWMNLVINSCTSNRGNLPLDLVACLEGYAYRGSGRVFDIAEITAGIKLYLNKVCDCWGIMAPGTWKSIALGKGNLKKDLINRECLKKYGFENDKQDIVDSFLIGLAFIRTMVGNEKARAWLRKYDQNLIGNFAQLDTHYMRGWAFAANDKHVPDEVKRHIYDRRTKVVPVKLMVDGSEIVLGTASGQIVLDDAIDKAVSSGEMPQYGRRKKRVVKDGINIQKVENGKSNSKKISKKVSK